MEKYIVTIKETYYCAYVPSAHSQKFAFDKVEGSIKVSAPSVTSDEAPVAFRLNDYSHKEDGKTEIRWWQGQCWKRMTKKDLECGGEIRDIKASEFHFGAELPHGYARNRQLCIKKYQEAAKRYLIVDGSVWLRCGEPRYVVNTFGLGHNHGGTGLFVEEFYNSNISNTNYFSALDGDAAVAHANKVAARRGDTNDIGHFEKMIDVLIPEAVSLRPIQEHGDGDPFINKINAVTELAPDSSTAGILAMMVAAKEIRK